MRNHFILKKAFSRALTVLIAVVVSYFFSTAEKYWMVLAAVFVMQTTIGGDVRQGLQKFLLILVGLILGTLLQSVIPLAFNTCIFGACILSAGCLLAMKGWGRYFFLSIYFLFSLIVFFALVSPDIHSAILHARVYDVTIGAVIGIIINVVVFPSRVDVEFRHNMVPIFQRYSHYLTAIMALLFKKPDAVHIAAENKIQLEKTLQVQGNAFPVWVYDAGLSVTLQPGHRHFLIMSERVGEILFSLHRIAQQAFDPVILTALEKPLDDFAKEANKVFSALIQVLSLQKMQEPVGDLKDELIKIEDIFKNTLPVSIEWVDVADEYLDMASLIEDLKDLRLTLVSLGNALRSSQLNA